MKEYIEKAALKERFQKRLIWLKKDVHDEYSKGLYHGCETDMGLIDEILAADVVEVRHGRWSPVSFGIGICTTKYRCSICKQYENVDREYKYCPNCGARMDAKGG